MKLSILLLVLGLGLIIYLAKIKFQKRFLSEIGIFIGILFIIYGIILFVQPDNYIEFTKTTISK